MKKIEINPQPIFSTPKDMKALQDWIEQLSGGEKIVAYTAAGMAWNLAAKIVAENNKEPEKEVDSWSVDTSHIGA